jgi:putative FmdB family regulatory protein
MANYDYQCEDCENIQEELHPMTGPNYEIVCKECGSKNMQKQLGTPYAQFKGEGWDTNQNRGIQG